VGMAAKALAVMAANATNRIQSPSMHLFIPASLDRGRG
jgi:hypothetical protein